MGTHLKPSFNYDPEKEFVSFLKKLRANSQPEWLWLLDMFRDRVIPWLYKKDGNLPREAIVSTNEFVEEVFANSLFRFYELFPTGEFNSLADLRGLIFRIAEFKLKEGYKSIKRDGIIYFTDDVSRGKLSEFQDKQTVDAYVEIETISTLREQLDQMSPEDREMLLRYARGEELGSIAENLNITPAACRKRKQRALDKLKALVSKGLTHQKIGKNEESNRID